MEIPSKITLYKCIIMRTYIKINLILLIIGIVLISGCVQPKQSACGNGICEVDENCFSCLKDCKCGEGEICSEEKKICVKIEEEKGKYGDGVCDAGENCLDHQKDCKCRKEEYCSQEEKKCVKPICGNGKCENYENSSNCCLDCACPINHFCQNNECQEEPKCGVCQHLQNHKCINYECCADEDCDDADIATRDKCINPSTVTSSCEHTEIKCSDGTIYNKCSETKPKYCDEGVLVDNCFVCGCSSGQNCQTDGSCSIVPCSETNSIYFPEDTICAKAWYNGRSYSDPCFKLEVCSPDLDYIVGEAKDCCDNGICDNSVPHIFTGHSHYCFDETYCYQPDDATQCHDSCHVAYNESELNSGYSENKFKKCLAIYILDGFGATEHFMKGYGQKECKPIGETLPDNTWVSDTNMSENICKLAPTHANINILHTGICWTYADAVATAIRKAGYNEDEIYTTSQSGCCEGHAFNLIKFPGENLFTIIDTVGNAEWRNYVNGDSCRCCAEYGSNENDAGSVRKINAQNEIKGCEGDL
ncbi:MAG: hypothetical protein KAU95_04285 [Candidatus Aenigmarchaeota archaeon]|nr:hypothetical protein [Candidatus Aenigmarchaeota archaeon]